VGQTSARYAAQSTGWDVESYRDWPGSDTPKQKAQNVWAIRTVRVIVIPVSQKFVNLNATKNPLEQRFQRTLNLFLTWSGRRVFESVIAVKSTPDAHFCERNGLSQGISFVLLSTQYTHFLLIKKPLWSVSMTREISKYTFGRWISF
jgi:hypothetical protein